MRRNMSPSRGSGRKRGLRFGSRNADKGAMDSTRFPASAQKHSATNSHERGQAVVEFALIAPLFLLIVVGIIQFGIGLNYWLDLNRIANQGARWAVVNKYPGCAGTPPCSPTLKAHLESQPISGGLNPTATICFESGAAVGQPVTVKLQSDFTFLPIMDLGTIQLRGNATMRIEQPPTVLQSQGVLACP